MQAQKTVTFASVRVIFLAFALLTALLLASAAGYIIRGASGGYVTSPAAIHVSQNPDANDRNQAILAARDSKPGYRPGTDIVPVVP